MLANFLFEVILFFGVMSRIYHIPEGGNSTGVFNGKMGKAMEESGP